MSLLQYHYLTIQKKNFLTFKYGCLTGRRKSLLRQYKPVICSILMVRRLYRAITSRYENWYFVYLVHFLLWIKKHHCVKFHKLLKNTRPVWSYNILQNNVTKMHPLPFWINKPPVFNEFQFCSNKGCGNDAYFYSHIL